MISPETFSKVGRTLFGDEFCRPLARALRMNPRNVERFAAGERVVPDSVKVELAQLLRAHFDSLLAELHI